MTTGLGGRRGKMTRWYSSSSSSRNTSSEFESDEVFRGSSSTLFLSSISPVSVLITLSGTLVEDDVQRDDNDDTDSEVDLSL